MIDLDRRIVRVNPALVKMLGYSEKELLQLTPVEITHPVDLEMTDQYLDTILGDGPDSLSVEKRYIRKDGAVIWGEVSDFSHAGRSGREDHGIGGYRGRHRQDECSNCLA